MSARPLDAFDALIADVRWIASHVLTDDEIALAVADLCRTVDTEVSP